jgi:hypothetical protein
MKLHPNAAKLFGQRFGRLIANEPCRRTTGGQIVWRCKCDCGGTAEVFASNLIKGHTQSCGCIWLEAVDRTTHGLSDSSEYITWSSAKQRCYDEKNKRYDRYGGRGIVMCQRWRESFEAFLGDMGRKPSGLTIDRIENDGNYSCGKCDECKANGWTANCRWANSSEQNNNTSVVAKYELDGELLTLAALSERCGLSRSTLKQRLQKRGWSLSDAMSVPHGKRRPLAIYDQEASQT